MSLQPRLESVQCISPAGLHRLGYVEWGERDNPRVLLCVHGLTRVGRDFDLLARRLVDTYRVVCPDVVGRGRSDWLRNPNFYVLPQYVADMVTLIARLDVTQVDFVGTSMGGLIGMSLAGLEGAPVGRLVLNDVGPRIESVALERIGGYVGQPVRFTDLEEAIDYIAHISAGFGLRTRDEWRSITETVFKRDGEAWLPHYDPAVAVPFRSATPQSIAAGEAALWHAYDAIKCPTLLTRGRNSDLLSSQTASEMTRRGPKARLVEFDDVGHAPMFMHDEQIAVVRDFLLGGNR